MNRPYLSTNPSPEAMNRRQLLHTTVGTTVGFSMLPWLTSSPLSGQDAKPLNRFPRMVQDFMVSQVRKTESRKLRTLESLATKADAEAYVKSVQEKIRSCFGPNPE